MTFATKLQLRQVSKFFGELRAVGNVDLEVQQGEFFSIVGPSGSGKTTLLRILAGFEKLTTGQILADGRDITGDPPQRRNMAMVFQNYALFPHMTVFENVAFGLEAQHLPKSDIQRRVDRVLALVQLNHKVNEPVPHLSGGEQQRAAVARALVVEPSVLLMDEPLSNLDVTLRVETREQLRLLQQRIKITTVYVTHDQSEALALSDRMGVMNEGKLVQVGTPQEIYNSPQCLFVATFLGNANTIRGTALQRSDRCVDVVIHQDVKICVPHEGDVREGQRVIVAVKPEHVKIVPASATGSLKAEIISIQFLGVFTEYLLKSSELIIRVLQTGADKSIRIGTRVSLEVDGPKCSVFTE
ncbi:MAG: ABC transporter ATP-binding protein [Bacteroidota bacterium]